MGNHGLKDFMGRDLLKETGFDLVPMHIIASRHKHNFALANTLSLQTERR